MRVGGDEAHPDVPVGRSLDPPRGKDAVGIAIDEQRQHQPRVVLRLAASLRVCLEHPQPHPLNRRHDEMRDVVLGQPIPQVGRQQKWLVTVKRYVRRHPEILPHSLPEVNPTGC